MGHALTAAILSAFLFPGSGHLYLKRPLMGWALALTSLAPLSYLGWCLVQAISRMFALIEKQLLPPDFAVLVGYLVDQPFGNNTQWPVLAMYLLLFIWLTGIIDSIRIGRQLERQ